MSSSDKESDEQMKQFWKTQNDLIDDIDPDHADWKLHPLPLARIKKVMKLDDSDIKFISADGPLVFAKACEIFILELTLRAWNFTAKHKRRTLQRNDVALAVADFDMFDFLIDIVPRPEGQNSKRGRSANRANDMDEASSQKHMQEYMKLLSQQQHMFFGAASGADGVAGEQGEEDSGDSGILKFGDEGSGEDGLGASAERSASDIGESDAPHVSMQQYYQQMMQMFAQSPAR